MTGKIRGRFPAYIRKHARGEDTDGREGPLSAFLTWDAYETLEEAHLVALLGRKGIKALLRDFRDGLAKARDLREQAAGTEEIKDRDRLLDMANAVLAANEIPDRQLRTYLAAIEQGRKLREQAGKRFHDARRIWRVEEAQKSLPAPPQPPVRIETETKKDDELVAEVQSARERKILADAE